MVKGTMRATTYESYECLIRCHIEPELGRRKLKTLVPDHVQALYQRKMDSGLSPGTVRQIYSVPSRALDQAVKCELPDIRFQDLRHTCTALLLSRGHHPKFVQELLVHASVALTFDRYYHVLPGIGDQTAAAMKAALS